MWNFRFKLVIIYRVICIDLLIFVGLFLNLHLLSHGKKGVHLAEIWVVGGVMGHAVRIFVWKIIGEHAVLIKY